MGMSYDLHSISITHFSVMKTDCWSEKVQEKCYREVIWRAYDAVDGTKNYFASQLNEAKRNIRVCSHGEIIWFVYDGTHTILSIWLLLRKWILAGIKLYYVLGSSYDLPMTVPELKFSLKFLTVLGNVIGSSYMIYLWF